MHCYYLFFSHIKSIDTLKVRVGHEGWQVATISVPKSVLFAGGPSWCWVTQHFMVLWDSTIREKGSGPNKNAEKQRRLLRKCVIFSLGGYSKRGTKHKVLST